MTGYDMALVVGCTLMLAATISIFAAGWTDKPKTTGLFLFLLAGGFLLFASNNNVGGMNAADIPSAYGKLIGSIF
ncbi:MAG TPA: hypothetical protein VLA51_00770 [Paracoccaceae bacterium]|nr:hypothetical protein [Paracoccaceae bacterium]